MRCRFALLLLAALPLAAQEPRPAVLVPAFLQDPACVPFTLAWRYAPGDDSARALPQFDDARWTAVTPDLTNDPRGWNGVGWFRRHIVLDRALQGRPFALAIEARGAADVFVDGSLVLSVGRASSIMMAAARRDATLVKLAGPAHVLAVRYVYPSTAPRPPSGFGFRLSLARPAPFAPPASRDWVVALRGALTALPLFLALLHFALYAFDRRARVNLFYGAEMLAFAVLIFHEYRASFLTSDISQNLDDRISTGLPILAIFFGMLTYYAVRMNRLPRSWRPFAALGAVLFIVAYAIRGSADIVWIVYFAVMIVEIVRVERSGATVQRGGTAFFLVSFVIFGAAIVLQIFVNFNVIQSVAGIREVYVFGIVASAVGMSLYLANNLSRSRVIEAENERKTGELTRARRLQLAMLPKELPRVDGLDVAVATQTAAEVGGDYYDVRRDGDGSLLFAFGDATGHGLASGILVTAAKALFTSASTSGSLGASLSAFDRALREMQLPGFLRMCLALARVSPREAAVASAAMPPILIHRAADSSILELGRGDLPLGSRLGARYEEQRAALAPGDTLLFASDGFAEQSRSDGRQFGYDGVADALRAACAARNANAIVGGLLAIAQEFRGSEPQHDDITLLVVRVTT